MGRLISNGSLRKKGVALSVRQTHEAERCKSNTDLADFHGFGGFVRAKICCVRYIRVNLGESAKSAFNRILKSKGLYAFAIRAFIVSL